MKENNLIIVKSGLNIKADLLEHWRKEILKQKETGVIVLPWYLDVIVVPEDMKVQFDPSGIVLEDLKKEGDKE